MEEQLEQFRLRIATLESQVKELNSRIPPYPCERLREYWEKHWDPVMACHYYYNSETDESRWVRPKEA